MVGRAGSLQSPVGMARYVLASPPLHGYADAVDSALAQDTQVGFTRSPPPLHHCLQLPRRTVAPRAGAEALVASPHSTCRSHKTPSSRAQRRWVRAAQLLSCPSAANFCDATYWLPATQGPVLSGATGECLLAHTCWFRFPASNHASDTGRRYLAYHAFEHLALQIGFSIISLYRHQTMQATTGGATWPTTPWAPSRCGRRRTTTWWRWVLMH